MSKLSRRGFTSLAISAGVVVASFAPVTASATPTHAASAQRTSKVIVVLRDQHATLSSSRGNSSARVLANRSDQASVMSQAKALGASHLHGFGLINAFAATVTPAQAASLASDPSVSQVFPDLTIRMAPQQREAVRNVVKAAITPTDVNSGICPTDPAKPLLEPEALQTTNTAFTDPTMPQAQDIVDGSGVKVGFIADGLDINNPDFIRADGTHVFADFQDFSGDGPNAKTGGAEAFGDASAIAAQAERSTTSPISSIQYSRCPRGATSPFVEWRRVRACSG